MGTVANNPRILRLLAHISRKSDSDLKKHKNTCGPLGTESWVIKLKCSATKAIGALKLSNFHKIQIFWLTESTNSHTMESFQQKYCKNHSKSATVVYFNQNYIKISNFDARFQTIHDPQSQIPNEPRSQILNDPQSEIPNDPRLEPKLIFTYGCKAFSDS